MSELKSHPVSSAAIAVTEHELNGVPIGVAGRRHLGRWGEGARDGEREAPFNRTARVRLVAGSAIGIGCLFVANWLTPEQGSLFAAPSGPAGWAAIVCGIAGIWLAPGLWLSAVMMRVGAGSAAWLGTRVATTLAWYALVGPVIHDVGQGARVTTGGILTATTAATAAVSLGVALGLPGWPARPWLRVLMSAVIGGACAQAVIWAAMRVWTEDMSDSPIRRLEWLIVLGCALLVALGTLSRPTLPPMLTARNMRTPLVALAVIATTAAALLAMGARWSPAQRMPSAFSAEQIPAPAGADVAFALTAIGPEGSELIRRADFTAADDTGRPIPVDTRLVLADGTADQATLRVVLLRSSEPVLCGEGRTVRASETGAPVKLTMRDQASSVLVQAVLPGGWCAR